MSICFGASRASAEGTIAHLAVLDTEQEGILPGARLQLLYRWFLDMDLMEPRFDPTVFTKNRRRPLRHRMERKLFKEVTYAADRRG